MAVQVSVHHDPTRRLSGLWCLLRGLGGRIAAADQFETPQLVVEIEWRGQAHMGQDECLELTGLQVGHVLQRDTNRAHLTLTLSGGWEAVMRLLQPLTLRDWQSIACDDDAMHRWHGDEAKVRQYLRW